MATSGSLAIPFGVQFQLNVYNESFFRPHGQIRLSINTSNGTNAFNFADNTQVRLYTSLNGTADTATLTVIQDNFLFLEDVITFSYDIASPVTAPRKHSFSAELFSADDSTTTTVSRGMLFQGSVTLTPPGDKDSYQH